MTQQPGNSQQPDAIDPAPAAPASEAPGTVVIRERKKKRKKKRKKSGKRYVPTAVKVIVAILAALALIVGGVFLFLNYNIKKGDEQLHAPDVQDTARTVSYNGHRYEYNDNVVAIMVMGKDDETSYGTDRSCTDANMLVTLDTETKAMNVVAIPRDSMVEVDLYDNGEYTRTGLYQLAVAYGVDVPTEDLSAKNTLKSVSKLLYNLPVERYFVMEMDAVPRLSSAVGGVKVVALDTYPGAPFEAGDTVLLEGDNALRYVRYRDIEAEGSAQARQERQMQFVKAFLDEVRQTDVTNVLNLYNTVQDTTFTNLDLSEITYLASLFIDGRGASIEYTTLHGETKVELDDDGVEREHIYLDEDSVMNAALKVFYTQVD